MQVTVKLFAILRDRAGVPEALLQLPPGSTVQTAVEALSSLHPPLASFLPRVAFAVNRTYAPAHTVLNDGDELALIPPVSGG